MATASPTGLLLYLMWLVFTLGLGVGLVLDNEVMAFLSGIRKTMFYIGLAGLVFMAGYTFQQLRKRFATR